MAITKDAVRIKFTAKFGKVNLSKDFKNALINKAYEKHKDDEDETGLDSYLESREDAITEAAAEVDRVRTSLKPKPVKEEQQEDVEIPLPIDTPDYIVALMKEVKANKEAIIKFQNDNKVSDIATRFKNDPRLKDVPEFVKKRAIPATEEEFESTIEELTGEYSKFALDNKIAVIGEDNPERANGGATTINQKALDSALDQWASTKVPQAQAK